MHGNEPAHHVPYLYNWAGAPWKAQERTGVLPRPGSGQYALGSPAVVQATLPLENGKVFSMAGGKLTFYMGAKPKK